MTEISHFKKLKRWLDMETKAEDEQFRERLENRSMKDIEKNGDGLGALLIRDEDSTVGDIILLTLSLADPNQRLPWTRLRVGTPIIISKDDGQKKVEPLGKGLISKLRDNSLQIALTDSQDALFENSKDRFRVDPSPNDVTMRRQRDALAVAESSKGPHKALREVLLGERDPQFGELRKPLTFSVPLNENQKKAIERALGAEHFSIIHGPPGTGKTTTVVELIRQAVGMGLSVLACAPSHTAVDNLLAGLADASFDVVRLGHPARVTESLRDLSLTALVAEHSDVKIAKKLRREARELRSKASKWSRATPKPGQRRELFKEAKELMNEARQLERQASDGILDSARVLCSTLTGLDDRILRDRDYDLVVIDEACQAVEPACWIPLKRSSRVIFAGDHCQLPPTIISPEAEREGFSISLPERLIEQFGADKVSTRLTVQYRMNEAIMDFPSMELYDGELVAHESAAQRKLADLAEVAQTTLTEEVAVFVDTAGAGYDEVLDDQSRSNPEEGEKIAAAVLALLETGVRAVDVAVITPYSAQVRWLRERLRDVQDLEIDTVDGFQGREKEAIFISLVRCNDRGEIGFLSDIRRMNVALTRARRKVYVLGDSATIGGHRFYKNMLEYFDSLNSYQTVWD